MTHAFFGFDVGTSSSKAVLIGENGELLDTATVEHSVTRGERGLVEMEMGIWWQEFRDLYSQLVGKNKVKVRGIGVSGMGPCVGMTTEAGEPLAASALYGIDWRALTEVKELTERYGEENLLATYDSALTSQAGGPKVAWFRKRYPQAFESGVRLFSRILGLSGT